LDSRAANMLDGQERREILDLPASGVWNDV
jgi:hypothetical protein